MIFYTSHLYQFINFASILRTFSVQTNELVQLLTINLIKVVLSIVNVSLLFNMKPEYEKRRCTLTIPWSRFWPK